MADHSNYSNEFGVELDPTEISPQALRGLIEEFVTREGTDYGSGERSDQLSGGGSNQNDPEWTLEDKVAQVIAQLEKGEARIVFDIELNTASIVTTRQPFA